jgi:hypothetical protein
VDNLTTPLATLKTSRITNYTCEPETPMLKLLLI